MAPLELWLDVLVVKLVQTDLYEKGAPKNFSLYFIFLGEHKVVCDIQKSRIFIFIVKAIVYQK